MICRNFSFSKSFSENIKILSFSRQYKNQEITGKRDISCSHPKISSKQYYTEATQRRRRNLNFVLSFKIDHLVRARTATSKNVKYTFNWEYYVKVFSMIDLKPRSVYRFQNVLQTLQLSAFVWLCIPVLSDLFCAPGCM